MNATVRALKSQRATGVTIFRAGFVCLAGLVLMYLYLHASTTEASAILGTALGLFLPIACFVVGFITYASAVNQLKAQGITSAGLLRRQEKDTGLTDDQEDIWRHLASQFDE